MKKTSGFIIILLLFVCLAGSSAHADGWNFPVNNPTGCGCAGGVLTVHAVCRSGVLATPIVPEAWHDYPVNTNGTTPDEHQDSTVTDVAFKWDCAGDSPACECTTSWVTLSGETKWFAGNTWITPPFGAWVDQNVGEATMPVLHVPETCGEGTGGELHIHVNLGIWSNSPTLPSYSFVDGECPDLPGYLIGTTPIVFDPSAPEGVYPFSTANPFTGTLLVHGEVSVEGTPAAIPTLGEWGMILLILLVLAAGAVVITRWRKSAYGEAV